MNKFNKFFELYLDLEQNPDQKDKLLELKDLILSYSFNDRELVYRFCFKKYCLQASNQFRSLIYKDFLIDLFLDDIDWMEYVYLHLYREYVSKSDNIIRLDLFKDILLKTYKISSLWTEEIHELFRNYRRLDFKNNVVLESNGSTKCIRSKYVWGPNFNDLKDVIWNISHYDLNKNIRKKYWILDVEGNISKTERGLMNEGQMTILPEHSEFISQDFKDCAWIMNPVTLNKVIKIVDVFPFIKKNNIIISLTESDYSAYDFSILDANNIPWTNQMRSWKEGTAFYTCKYGNRHWLENLFYCTKDNIVIDLLNFYNYWYKDSNPDNIYVLEKNFKKCECGAWYRELNFEPHLMKWFYNFDGKLAEFQKPTWKFMNNYSYLQIIQKADLNTFLICSNPELNERDLMIVKSYIRNIYQSPKFQIEFSNKIFKVGDHKYPTFYSQFGH